MSWRVWAPVAVALFLLGYAAGSCGKATSAELEAAHDATAVAVQREQESEERRLLVEQRSRADSIYFFQVADSAIAVARAAEARRPTVIDRIVEREAPADTAVARRVAEAVADSMVRYEISPLRAALVAQEGAYAAQGRLLDAERETRMAAQEGLRRALEESGLLRDARPSWLARHWWKVAIPAAAYGGWRAHAAWAGRAP